MASTARSPTKSIATDISRRGLSRSENATTPITPPARYISSNFSTPGSTYGREEDAVILELSPRYIHAGIEGESHAQCRYEFVPSATRRVGDFRQHLPNHVRPAEPLSWETWGRGYELWRNNVKGLDLGLVGDKLERAVREIYNKHLLVDAGTAKLVLVVPSLVPHPFLDTLLMTLFQRWTFPSITLLPTTATALISAGLRSGMVVDIGWEETVITAIYEYREVKSYRSTRGVKMLTYNLAEWLKNVLPEQCRLDLETVERFWMRFAPHVQGKTAAADAGDKAVQADESDRENDNFEYDWPTRSFTETVKFSKTQLYNLWLAVFLAPRREHELDDDEELPLNVVLYNSLLHLPADIRGLCLSRLVFIGDGSNQTPFPEIIVKSVGEIVDLQGWTEYGKRCSANRTDARDRVPDVKHDDVIFSEKDITEERYLRGKHKTNSPAVHNVIRQVDTLGSWTGASLLSTLKIKSFVEVQRDKFLSHGIAGATREYEQSMVSQTRTSSLAMKPTGDRISWTMAGFG